MNKWLKGNGYWCPTCRGTGRGKPQDRIIYEGGGFCQFYANCSTCGGKKRFAASEEQLLENMVPVTPDPHYHTCFVTTIEYGRDKVG